MVSASREEKDASQRRQEWMVPGVRKEEEEEEIGTMGLGMVDKGDNNDMVVVAVVG